MVRNENQIDMKKYIMILTMAAMASCSPKVTQTENVPGSELGFSLDLFRNAVAHSSADDDVIVSPYSAGVALSMLMEGAEGETRAELDDALNGCVFKAADLGDNDTVTVKSANSVWLDDNFAVRNEYVNHLSRDYDALATTLSFADPATVHAINDWCSEHTDGMIKGIVSKLTPDMTMILANALYFKAPWESPFRSELTSERVFHGSKGDSQVPFMSQQFNCAYAAYEGNQFVALPYEGGRYAMYVLLPSKDLGVEGVLPYITEYGLKELQGTLARNKVNLRLPKFKIETGMSLIKTLQSMGVKTAFTPAADLSGIARGPLTVSQVLQKAVVEVDEKGSEAAAVTAIGISLTSARVEPVPVMTVDRPFYFMIADLEEGRVLFAGRVMNL